jgi:hypothetical protein
MQFKISKAEQVKKIGEILGQEFAEGAVLTVTAPKGSTPRPCECECGELTSGGLWLPGHDARRKSRLYAAIRSGIPGEIEIAKAELTRREWPMPSTKKGGAYKPLATPTSAPSKEAKSA